MAQDCIGTFKPPRKEQYQLAAGNLLLFPFKAFDKDAADSAIFFDFSVCPSDNSLCRKMESTSVKAFSIGGFVLVGR